MSQEYWLQQSNEPLFPDLLWSRPETRAGAGKLLIIGGQAQEFAHVAECYAAADQAGAGTIRIIMPDSTRKITGHLPNIEYAPSNQSGSFASEALDTLLEASHWADGVLLAGNLGKNSETSLMLEKFLSQYKGLLCVAPEALISFSVGYKNLIDRVKTILIFNLPDLQKTAAEIKLTIPITSASSNLQTAEALNEISSEYPATIIFLHNSTAWAATDGNVSSTQTHVNSSMVAPKCTVWAIQNPGKVFEAVTSALLNH